MGADWKLKVKKIEISVMLPLTFSVSKLEVEIVRLEERNIKRALKQPQCTPGGHFSPVSHQHYQPQWSAREVIIMRKHLFHG